MAKRSPSKNGSPAPPKARRRPRQARAQAMVDAILTAAAHLLREGGPDAATTNRVAERAGASIGSLYQYFPNKRALFTAVAEQHLKKLEVSMQALATELIELPIEELPRTAVVGLFSTIELDAGLHAALQRISLWGQTSDLMRDFRVRIEGRFGFLIAARAAELPNAPADPQLSARILIRAIGGVLDAGLAEDPAGIQDPRMISRCTHMVASYFGLPSSPDEGESRPGGG